MRLAVIARLSQFPLEVRPSLPPDAYWVPLGLRSHEEAEMFRSQVRSPDLVVFGLPSGQEDPGPVSVRSLPGV